MKKLLLLIFSVLITSTMYSQDRNDSNPISLSWKSKEVKKALYWHQNSSTGQWESRKCSKLVYLGEGIDVENFHSIFIGKYSDRCFLFLDRNDYKWRYPNLEHEWLTYRVMHAALLSEYDYNKLDSLKIGEQYTFTPRFSHKMFKGHREYSFPFFIKLGETLLSTTETMYNSYLRTDGEDIANRYWKNNYPPIPFITLKRYVDSQGNDVIRFRFGPVVELIDSSYFEIKYEEYRNLFVPDKKKIYK